MVFANPFVEENQEYRGKTGETTFYYDKENMQVNAFVPHKKRKIIFCDGYLNYLFAVETIFKHRFYDKLTLLSKTLFDNKFSFSFEEISEVTGYEPDQDIIRNGFISSFETIAHELGHSCLDHIFTLRDNLDVSRNLERQADEFAASVIASSCFNDKLFSFHIKSCVAWAVDEKDGGIVEPGTHPFALERLKNAIRNNSELARDLGIDVNWVTKMFG